MHYGSASIITIVLGQGKSALVNYMTEIFEWVKTKSGGLGLHPARSNHDLIFPHCTWVSYEFIKHKQWNKNE